MRMQIKNDCALHQVLCTKLCSVSPDTNLYGAQAITSPSIFMVDVLNVVVFYIKLPEHIKEVIHTCYARHIANVQTSRATKIIGPPRLDIY